MVPIRSVPEAFPCLSCQHLSFDVCQAPGRPHQPVKLQSLHRLYVVKRILVPATALTRALAMHGPIHQRSALVVSGCKVPSCCQMPYLLLRRCEAMSTMSSCCTCQFGVEPTPCLAAMAQRLSLPNFSKRLLRVALSLLASHAALTICCICQTCHGSCEGRPSRLLTAAEQLCH